LPLDPAGDAEIPVPLVARRDAPREEELDIAVDVAPPSVPVIDVPLESVPLNEVPAAPAPAAEPPAPSPIVAAPAPVAPIAPTADRPSSVPPGKASPVPSSGRPGSMPGVPRRRAPGEDLIGELFERMHELSFMVDMVSGAEFVLHVLGELIPCEGILVHVFDLGKREFVVVRAQGPNARGTLLHRTADGEPIVRSIMSRRGAVVLDGAPANLPPASSSLGKLGIQPRAVLCGAARLGGRYLGLIELANPAGGQPFHDGESNALDYVCEQFAEFVASRPIILDADVVVGDK
jgi:hypothetical protein